MQSIVENSFGQKKEGGGRRASSSHAARKRKFSMGLNGRTVRAKEPDSVQILQTAVRVEGITI